MHGDFGCYHMPIAARRVLIARRRRGGTGVLGMEIERRQWDYTVHLDGVQAGVLWLLELAPKLAFVMWVHVEAWARGFGLGEALHRRVLGDFGALAVEDFASNAELRLLASMARGGGLRLTPNSDPEVAQLGIFRHCRLVDRMLVLDRSDLAQPRVATRQFAATPPVPDGDVGPWLT